MSPYEPQILPLADLDLARLLPQIGPANARGAHELRVWCWLFAIC
jgi:hypothetical protein